MRWWRQHLMNLCLADWKLTSTVRWFLGSSFGPLQRLMKTRLRVPVTKYSTPFPLSWTEFLTSIYVSQTYLYFIFDFDYFIFSISIYHVSYWIQQNQYLFHQPCNHEVIVIVFEKKLNKTLNAKHLWHGVIWHFVQTFF